MEQRVTIEERLQTRATILNNVEYHLANSESKTTRKLIAEGVVYRKFLDLTVFYEIPLQDCAREIGSYVVMNKMLITADITQEELEKSARENTVKNNHFVKLGLIQEYNRIMKDAGAEDIELTKINKSNSKAYVLTSEKIRDGANILLYKEEIERLANTLKADLYLLPVNTDEIIAVPTIGYGTVEELTALLQTWHESEYIGDALGKSVYKYSRAKNEINIAKESEQ